MLIFFLWVAWVVITLLMYAAGYMQGRNHEMKEHIITTINEIGEKVTKYERP